MIGAVVILSLCIRHVKKRRKYIAHPLSTQQSPGSRETSFSDLGDGRYIIVNEDRSQSRQGEGQFTMAGSLKLVPEHHNVSMINF